MKVSEILGLAVVTAILLPIGKKIGDVLCDKGEKLLESIKEGNKDDKSEVA